MRLVVVSLAVNLGVSATKMKCLLISPLNYIRNINFFVFSFLKYRGFMFFVISIFVVAKEHVVNSWYIFMLFLAFFQHFLVYLSELFWSEFARAATFIMLLPFCFGALNLSIYLPAIYLQICPYDFINRNSTIYQNSLSWKSDSNKDFIRTLLGCADMYCHQKIVELDSQSLLFVPMF